MGHIKLYKILKSRRPTWCHLLFYFTSYALNMFRTLIYPSLGACDYSVELPHWSYCSWLDVCWSFGVVGLEWYPCCRLKHNSYSSTLWTFRSVFHEISENPTLNVGAFLCTFQLPRELWELAAVSCTVPYNCCHLTLQMRCKKIGECSETMFRPGNPGVAEETEGTDKHFLRSAPTGFPQWR